MRPRSYAILIDAGFLKRKLGSRERPLTADTTNRFIERLTERPELAGLHLHRVYFYDAPPLTSSQRKPLAGGRVTFGETELARHNQRLHKELRNVPFMALRMGDLRFRGWTLNVGRLPADEPQVEIKADDLRPNVHQKGVDMRRRCRSKDFLGVIEKTAGVYLLERNMVESIFRVRITRKILGIDVRNLLANRSDLPKPLRLPLTVEPR